MFAEAAAPAGALPLRGAAIAVRAVVATLLLLLVAHHFARDVVALLLPALVRSLSWLAGDFDILRVELVNERGSLNIGVLARLAHTLVLGGRAIVPDNQSVVMVGASVGSVLQPVVVALVLVAAWPASLKELVQRVLLVVPLLILVLCVDTPFSLAAWLWDTQLRQYAPGATSPLVAWNVFLNGGGRLALGLVAGALAIAGARRR